MDEGRSLTLQQHFNTACLLCLLTGLVLWMRTAVLHEKEETLHCFSLEKEKPSSLCSQTRRYVNTPFSHLPFLLHPPFRLLGCRAGTSWNRPEATDWFTPPLKLRQLTGRCANSWIAEDLQKLKTAGMVSTVVVLVEVKLVMQ